MRAMWVVLDTVARILSVKNLILSLVAILAVVLLSLGMTTFWGSSPAWRDLYKESIAMDFNGYMLLFGQMLLNALIVIISAITAKELYFGDTEQIYLTGGISKVLYFAGRLTGILLYAFIMWWILFVAYGFTFLGAGLGQLGLQAVILFLQLYVNTAILCTVSIFLLGLARNLIVGLSPIIIAQYWLTLNNGTTVETAGTSMHKWANYVLPLNTFTQFPCAETGYWHMVMSYQELAPWHGIPYLLIYVLIVLGCSLFLYLRTELT